MSQVSGIRNWISGNTAIDAAEHIEGLSNWLSARPNTYEVLQHLEAITQWINYNIDTEEAAAFTTHVDSIAGWVLANSDDSNIAYHLNSANNWILANTVSDDTDYLIMRLNIIDFWIAENAGADGLVARASYSALDFARGTQILYDGSYPIVFVLLILPAIVLVLSLVWPAHKIMLAVALLGLLSKTIFITHFAHGLHYRNFAEIMIFFWIVIISYVVLIAAIFFRMVASLKLQPPVNTNPPYSHVQKITIAAILLSMAIMLSMMASIVVPIAGTPLMTISFSGIFHNTVAILFGPLFGGIQRALADVIMFVIRPLGPFLWPLTVTAFLRGASIAFLWIKVRGIKPKVYSIGYSITFAALLAFGLFNLSAQLLFPDSAYVAILTPNPNNIVRHTSSFGFIIAGIVGLVPQIIIRKVTKKTGNTLFYDRYIKLLVAIVVPGLVFSTANTYILFLTAIGPNTIALGFTYFWIPRIFNELIISMINVYVLVLLLGVYEKAMKRKIIQNLG